MSSKSSQTKSRHKWVVLYWMPYDNDLVRFGEPVVEMLTRGTQNSEITVVVQSDYLGDPIMRRRQLVNGATNKIDVAGEDSSALSAFSELEWRITEAGDRFYSLRVCISRNNSAALAQKKSP